MSGYIDGFKVYFNITNQPYAYSKESFKVIVQVTNQLSEDIYGGITVNAGNCLDYIFNLAYGIYSPSEETVSNEFILNQVMF